MPFIIEVLLTSLLGFGMILIVLLFADLVLKKRHVWAMAGVIVLVACLWALLLRPPQEVDSVYHDAQRFDREYKLMMGSSFRVYMYPDEPNFKSCLPDGKFKTEILFYELLSNSHFNSLDPREASLFLVPFACIQGEFGQTARIDIDRLVAKYPYWDYGWFHVVTACPETGLVPEEEFHGTLLSCSPGRHPRMLGPFAEPQITDLFAYISDASLVRFIGHYPPANNELSLRETLAFWVGEPAPGPVNQIIQRWRNDPEFQIMVLSPDEIKLNGEEPPALKFHRQYLASKYCFCPRTHQPSTLCLTISIRYGCVPVILWDGIVLPFEDILVWNRFSVKVNEGSLPRLKKILKGIPYSEYQRLQKNVVKVQKHFQWNSNPQQHDAFHMTMYDLSKKYLYRQHTEPWDFYFLARLWRRLVGS